MGCLVSLLIENGVLTSQVVYEDPVPVLRTALEYLPRYLPRYPLGATLFMAAGVGTAGNLSTIYNIYT